MEKSQSTENNGNKGSGIFFWIFIGMIAVFVLVFAIKYIWG
jgi:hypothetical protein